jgi:hypothetical protein
MKAEDLRALQAPLKALYRDLPEKAVITLKAEGELGHESITCKVETGRATASHSARATCCWRRWSPARASP